MTETRTRELLEKHYVGAISPEERRELHGRLKERHAYGDAMPEYRCPCCQRPLIFFWAFGPLCPWLRGGCGWEP